jgi:uncharacterized protein YhbP (UPF0306 family)
MNPKDIAKEIMTEVQLMTVCSVDNNKPWCFTAFFAFDDKLNIYFLSREYRRHSKNILKNSTVSGTIFSHDHKFGKPVRGIQFEGTCKKVEENNLKKIFSLYRKRYPDATKHTDLKGLTAQDDKKVRLWIIKPKMIKIHDEKNFGSEGRELVL